MSHNPFTFWIFEPNQPGLGRRVHGDDLSRWPSLPSTDSMRGVGTGVLSGDHDQVVLDVTDGHRASIPDRGQDAAGTRGTCW